ncbi:MAG: hypothetical protein A3H27_12765 [Acidobacteria bacterium RIFCSPLOWO2_02_FULL_59_13]|nr:MAG: hypothetical protein A3H27_12765 [Acidobacteria bacterium RIFCSPLOWO2_02_FULL_59_13]OGA68047.1 MAG: hypothetical protein A3G81_20550 [Betaproteobacteria bacterium RIFCSPLOWO2_12_FULL_65_14]
MSRVFIGMPVRNGSVFIRQAIDSLRGQTFEDWNLLISDNASTDETFEICRDVAALDPRIKVVAERTNIGAGENFSKVLRRAEGNYFMWAAADDQWRPQFLDTCVNALASNPSLGMAFTGLENIDREGRIVRRYPDLPKLAGPAQLRTVARYLLSREICGKANLIYSVYQLELCRRVADHVGFPNCWGADMAFVLGAIARGGVSIDARVLFQKRWSDAEMINSGGQVELSPPANGGIFPLDQFESYKAGLLSAVTGTGFGAATRLIMNYRFYRERLSRRLESLTAT